MDIIASSAFSMKIDSHNDPNNRFVQIAKKAFSVEFGYRIALLREYNWFNSFLFFDFFDPTNTN